MIELDVVELTADEVEALKLKEYEELDQSTAAEKMGISQPTFYRIYSSAKKKVAKALFEGRALMLGDNMPYGDGTGPYGTGPVGRRLGPCGQNPQNKPNEEQATNQQQNQPFLGRNFGWGFGRGYGQGRGFGRGQGGGFGRGGQGFGRGKGRGRGRGRW